MENLKRSIVRIAYTPDSQIFSLPLLQRLLLLPVLSAASYFYSLAGQARVKLYQWGMFRLTRLPVPVVSVGNLTWGGNGKTPLVEFLATLFVEYGLHPLVLTRGYAGGDESRMLHRHLENSAVKIGLGPNRSAVASVFLRKYGAMEHCRILELLRGGWQDIRYNASRKRSVDGIGVIILDDGMQHWRLFRDVEILIVNCLTAWGCGRTVPRGPLREPLAAIRRADIVILHHVDLASLKKIDNLTTMVQSIAGKNIPLFHSKMKPCYFLRIHCLHVKVPLDRVQNEVVLCISGIGCPESFSLTIQKLGAFHVDRLDFSDHHTFLEKDFLMIQERLCLLYAKFRKDVIVVITEKDFERDRLIFTKLDAVDVLVLHSTFTILNCFKDAQCKFKTILFDKVMRSLCIAPAEACLPSATTKEECNLTR